jgi:hypothetical protein
MPRVLLTIASQVDKDANKTTEAAADDAYDQ